MLEELKNTVFKANLELVSNGLVINTWGNVSGRDLKTGLVAIKPSGVSYEVMKADDMVVIDPDGKVIEGRYKPSTDTPAHLMLYKSFPEIGGVVHTHSTFATAWAQAGKAIPPFGTTHADHFHGDIPCSRLLSEEEVRNEYEKNIGKVIIETLGPVSPLTLQAVLVNGHGPFCWSSDPAGAVCIAVALEEIAKMAVITVLLGNSEPVNSLLLDKHFKRKHGSGAYYGQSRKNKPHF